MALKFDKLSKSFEDAKKELGIKRAKQITTPVLSTRGGANLLLCFLDKPSEKIDIDKTGKQKMRDDGTPSTITIVTVFDLINKEKAQLVMHSVLKSELTANYPKGFCGLCFDIEIPKEKAEGKQYKVPKIYEIFAPDWLDDELKKLLPAISLAGLLASNK